MVEISRKSNTFSKFPDPQCRLPQYLHTSADFLYKINSCPKGSAGLLATPVKQDRHEKGISKPPPEPPVPDRSVKLPKSTVKQP